MKLNKGEEKLIILLDLMVMIYETDIALEKSD